MHNNSIEERTLNKIEKPVVELLNLKSSGLTIDCCLSFTLFVNESILDINYLELLTPDHTWPERILGSKSSE